MAGKGMGIGMAEMTARAETELKLLDSWMEANFNDPRVVIDLVKREPVDAFEPNCRLVPATTKGRFQNRGFRIDNDRSSATASYAYLNRALLNHQLGQNLNDRFACGVMHPESIRYIYPYQTTARGISVYC